MPIPDAESPEKSLGDCAICMDSIIVDTPHRHRSKSTDERGDYAIKNERTSAGGGLLNAVQMGVSASNGRKNYSLAPCHHLFVSYLVYRIGTKKKTYQLVCLLSTRSVSSE